MNDPRTPLSFSPPGSPPAGAPPAATTGTKKLGRPRALDDAKKREICALIAAGVRVARASRYVGCCEHTVQNEARRDRDFAEKLERAEAQAELEPLSSLRHKAKTNWRAAAYLLDKLAGDEKQTQSRGKFDQQCLIDLRRDFQTRIEKVITDIELRGNVARTFLACLCRFTRELDRMLPSLNLDLEAQKDLEKRLKEKGFLP
jgi:hypothetical protein